MSMIRWMLAVTMLCVAGVVGAQSGGAPTRVQLKTSMGAIVIELDRAKAPITVDNFLSYVKSGHYNGTIFHRVINGFMIQGGGFTPDMNQKPTQAPIKLESQNGLRNDTGTVAMARTGVPDSATAQFFINVTNNDMLNYTPSNPGYAVFGKVVQGMDVVNKIKAAAVTNRGMHQNVPVEPIFIERATVVE